MYLNIIIIVLLFLQVYKLFCYLKAYDLIIYFLYLYIFTLILGVYKCIFVISNHSFINLTTHLYIHSSLMLVNGNKT